MKFVSKSKFVNLELVSESGEERTYVSNGIATAEFAERVMRDFVKYLEAQKTMEEADQDKLFIANIKFLAMMFADLEVDWLKNNFSVGEITEIKEWAVDQLSGIKKESKS